MTFVVWILTCSRISRLVSLPTWDRLMIGWLYQGQRPLSIAVVTPSQPDPKPTLSLTASLKLSFDSMPHTHARVCARKVAYLCGFCGMMHRSAVPRETPYRRSAAAPFCTRPVGPSPAFWKRRDTILYIINLNYADSIYVCGEMLIRIKLFLLKEVLLLLYIIVSALLGEE